MSYTKTVPRDAPRPPYACELVEVDIPAIPFMLAALGHKAQKFYWSNEDEATQGRQLLAKQAASLLMPCAKAIVESVDRLYRLTDVIHNGAIYSYTGTGTTLDPYVYNPAMPIVPARQPGLEPSVKFSLEKILRLDDNLVNGTTYIDAPDARNLRQQLDDILAALQGEDSLDPEILAKLVQILAALA